MFFFQKNESAGASLVQVCSKLAPNLHPKLCLFVLFLFFLFVFVFVNALNMFFYMFFHVVYCFFCENHLVLVGNKWITTVCVQVF